MNANLDNQVEALMDFILEQAPAARVERESVIYEDEHANLVVYPPLTWDEERCLDFQYQISEREVDIHLDSGYLILTYVYTPEQQIALAQRERAKAEQVLAEAETLGLLQPALG